MADKVWWGADSGNVGDYGVAANWQPSGVPVNGDNVMIPAGSNAISGTLDQSAVTLGSFYVEEGYDQAIGTYTAATPSYLQLDANAMFYAGTGTAYIEVRNGGGSLDVHVEAAGAQATTGIYLLYLTTDGTSTIGTLSVRAGAVALGSFLDDPNQTCTNVRATGTNARILIGDPVTATNVHVDRGHVRSESVNTHTLIEQSGGTCDVIGAAAVTTLTLTGGTLRAHGGGTYSTLTVDGGTLIATDGDARVLSTLNFDSGTLQSDPDVTTISTLVGRQDVPFTMTVAKL
jgi:hypothetical protein